MRRSAGGCFRILLKMFPLVSFLVASRANPQTSISVYRTDTTIYAAADSKALKFQDNAPPTVCKFFKTGDIFFGVSGVYFDAYSQMVAQAHVSPDTIRSSIKQFETAFRLAVQPALEKMRKEEAAQYSSVVLAGKPEIDFTFFGMKKKVPVIAVVAFHIAGGAESIKLSLTTEEFFDGPHCTHNNFVCGASSGYNKAAIAYQAKHPDWWKSRNLASVAEHFVQLEIEAVPEHVGPPIRVLQIDASGPRWVKNREGCNSVDIP